MDQGAIHLEQALEHIARIGWDVQNHLLEDQQWFLTVDDQMVDPALVILHDEDLLGRIFVYNYQVELMHVTLNGLKICHPRPLQAATISTPPVQQTMCLRASAGLLPLCRRMPSTDPTEAMLVSL
jgi:hypothetical protein